MNLLREVRLEDRETIFAWRNLPQVADFMFTDHVITPEEHACWFARTIDDCSSKLWIIVCDGKEVGVANLYNIDRKNLRCYWGFYIASAHARGKGAATYTEYTVLNYVFDELKMEKLCCETLLSNKGVLEMHRRFGFVHEGLFRRHVMKRGNLNDVVCLAILRDEWEAMRPKWRFKENDST